MRSPSAAATGAPHPPGGVVRRVRDQPVATVARAVPQAAPGSRLRADALSDTILRTANTARYAPPLVVGNHEHRFILAEQLHQLGVASGTLVVESVGRSTGPAAAVAALLLTQHEPDALMLVMPAEHVIADAGAFGDAVELARSPLPPVVGR
jgi:hypothetical protein